MDRMKKVAAAAQYEAVRRKLNITWEDDETELRVHDVILSVEPALALRCGLESGHQFMPGEPEWALFLNACLYEWSGALDDFWGNYAAEVGEAHLRNTIGASDA